jgi:hypothetical protein
MASAVAMAHPSRPRGVPAESRRIGRSEQSSGVMTDGAIRLRALSAVGSVVVVVVALLVVVPGGSSDASSGGSATTSSGARMHSRFGPVVHQAAPAQAGAPHHSRH